MGHVAVYVIDVVEANLFITVKKRPKDGPNQKLLG